MMPILRRWSNVLFALALFPAASFNRLTGMGRSISDNATTGGVSPEIPAGYAFSIWGVIFALTLVYAVHQALPSQRDNPLYARIGWATALSSAANVTWMMLAQTIGNGWWLVVVILLILVGALTTLFRVLAAPQLTRFERAVVRPMAGLLAGWVTAATWLNIASVVKYARPDRFGFTSTEFAMAVLAIVTIIGWTLLRRARGDGWFAGTLIWALVGVVVANTRPTGGDTIVATAAAGIALLTLAIALLLPVQAARARARDAATRPA